MSLRRLLYLLTLLASLAIPTVAQALTISQPTGGVTVDRTVVLVGQATPQAGLGVLIDGLSYVPPEVRDQPGESSVGNADPSGNFRVTLDLTGDRVVNDLSGPEIRSSGVAAGMHTITLREYFTGDHEPATAAVAVNVQDSPAAGDGNTGQVSMLGNNLVSPSPTGTPAASPRLSPTPLVAAAVRPQPTGWIVAVSGIMLAAASGLTYWLKPWRLLRR